jgi:hypothetical protein
MTPPQPLRDSLSRVPDNVRAELARRRMSGERLADLIHLSYATFKRRMEDPRSFRAGELADIAVALHMRIERLFADLNGEA